MAGVVRGLIVESILWIVDESRDDLKRASTDTGGMAAFATGGEQEC
jgi:hypothetical protein|tara:strand:+ start:1000 stop:1137 length:138 start_codon:yes stop_codon:yes gene_type:complete